MSPSKAYKSIGSYFTIGAIVFFIVACVYLFLFRGAALSYVWALFETQALQSAYFSGAAQKLGPLPVGNYKIQLIRPGKDIVIHDVFVNGESVQNLKLRFSE